MKKLLFLWLIAAFFLLSLCFVLPVSAIVYEQEGHGLNLPKNTPRTTMDGFRIKPNYNLLLYDINKTGYSTATTCYLLNASKNQVANASFSDNQCTFASPINLAVGVSYYIVADSLGATYTMQYENNQIYPISRTNINWTGGIDGADGLGGGVGTDNANNLLFVGTGPADNIFPDLTLLYPTSNAIIYQNKSIPLNFSVSDNIGLSSCWYSVNKGGTNTTISCSNTTIALLNSSSAYNLTIWASDTSGNVNSSTSTNITILYDTTNPSLTIVAPNQTYSGTTYIPVTITANDSGGLSYCYYNITRGASIEVSNTQILNCYNATFTVSGDANYMVYVCVNDTTGNPNCSSASFKVSSYVPPVPPVNPPSGGGGGFNIGIITNLTIAAKICEKNYPPLEDAWAVFQKDKNLNNFKTLWFAYWDYATCKSAANIIPLE